MELLKKTYSKGAVKDVSGRTVTGYYASWGANAEEENPSSLFIDSDGDVFTSDAFNKTIMQNGPKGSNRIWHLFNHNFGSAINKPKVLQADNFGVYFETVFPETTLGNDTLKLYEAGAITEHSVMFNIIQARNEAEYQLIQEVRMWEGSSVLWGANSNPPSIASKRSNSVIPNFSTSGTTVSHLSGRFKRLIIFTFIYDCISDCIAVVNLSQ